VQLASAAADDDLPVANFGLASSYLAADFYAKALASGKLGPEARGWLTAGRAAAAGHARELTTLLTGAGDTPAAAEDFEFAWSANTFTSAARIRSTGLGVLRPVRAAYQQAAATVSEPTHRVPPCQPRRELRGAGRSPLRLRRVASDANGPRDRQRGARELPRVGGSP
jgi:Ferritin-like domain